MHCRNIIGCVLSTLACLGDGFETATRATMANHANSLQFHAKNTVTRLHTRGMSIANAFFWSWCLNFHLQSHSADKTFESSAFNDVNHSLLSFYNYRYQISKAENERPTTVILLFFLVPLYSRSSKVAAVSFNVTHAVQVKTSLAHCHCREIVIALRVSYCNQCWRIIAIITKTRHHRITNFCPALSIHTASGWLVLLLVRPQNII